MKLQGQTRFVLILALGASASSQDTLPWSQAEHLLRGKVTNSISTCTEVISSLAKNAKASLAKPELSAEVKLHGDQFYEAVEEMMTEPVLESQFQNAGWKAAQALDEEIGKSLSFQDAMLCTDATSLLSSVLDYRYEYLFAEPRHSEAAKNASRQHVQSCLNELKEQLDGTSSVDGTCSSSGKQLLRALQQEKRLGKKR